MTITKNGRTLHPDDMPYALTSQIYDAMDEGQDYGTVWYCGERYQWTRF